MMKFEMIEKGYEYRAEGYTLKKTYVRRRVLRTSFGCMDRWADVQEWHVYPDDENVIYIFHTLAKAKAFCISREAERSAK